MILYKSIEKLKKCYYLFVMPRVSRLKLPPVETGEETIGQRIARLRKEKGYTQNVLAEKMGLIQALISAYELSKIRLNAEMVIRFSKVLDVSADEILGLKKDKFNGKKISLRIMRRLNKIESLPPGQQKTILQSIDLMLKAAEE